MRHLTVMVILCCLLSACQSSPRKNFYVLTASEAEQRNPTEDITQVIGIGPIEIAEYLDRIHIVYQADSGNLVMAENDYWAEPLDKGIARVIALNLTQRDASRSFVSFPWRRDSKPHYSLRLQMHSLNASAGNAQINASWELVDNVKKIKLRQRHFIRSTPAGSGTRALAEAYSKLLAELAEEMDQALLQTSRL